MEFERVEEIKNYRMNMIIRLDADQIFPNDPGQGTPAMVIKRKPGGRGDWTATFACAEGTGELECGEYILTAEEREWLASHSDRVTDFQDHWWPIIKVEVEAKQ